MKKYIRFSLLCAVLLCCLFSGCKKVDAPIAYELEGNTIPSLDTLIEDGSGKLVKIDEPTSEHPELYVFHYEEIEDPATLVTTYYEQLTSEEYQFVPTDENHQQLSEPPTMDGVSGDIILERTSENQETRIFQLRLNWTEENLCTVQLCCTDGEIKPPEPTSNGGSSGSASSNGGSEEEAPETTTMVDQLNHMYTYTPNELGLEGEDMHAYTIFPVEGIMSVDHISCRQFNVYQRREPENTNVIAGIYLLTLDLNHVYQLHTDTDTVTLLQ